MSDPTTSRRRSTGQPSIADVARLIGMSTQTVSRVARGENSVREATRDRVLEAMRQIGYTPNAAARALRYGQSRLIGLVAHEVAQTGEAHVIEAIIHAARERGYTVQLVDAATSAPEDFATAVGYLTGPLAGLIMLRARDSQADLDNPWALPVVVIDAHTSPDAAHTGFDQRSGVRAAVEHLLDLGHETVHHVAGPASSSHAELREETWRGVLIEHGRNVPEPLQGDWTPASGHLAGQQLMADPGVTAIFCANDEMAAGVLRAAHQAGRSVPEELSIVGFDDHMAEYLWPPLTTITSDYRAVGQQLIDLLVAQIEDEPLANERYRRIPMTLMVRESTAAPKVSK